VTITGEDDDETLLNLLRRAHHAELFRVLARDVEGVLTVEQVADELSALADSAGAEPVARVVQSRTEPDPATWIGRGKLEDLHTEVHRNDAALVIFDQELTPGHLRTLESRLGVKVIDRTALILEIFALHARSREGKAQVELAQLNYLLPRLRGWGEAMTRWARRPHRPPAQCSRRRQSPHQGIPGQRYRHTRCRATTAPRPRPQASANSPLRRTRPGRVSRCRSTPPRSTCWCCWIPVCRCARI